MKFKIIYLAVIFCLCFSCRKVDSQPKDFEIDAYKLSNTKIKMENHTGEVNKSTMFYGEKITLFYEDISGFKKKDSLVYPDMHIFVTGQKGDTVLIQKNLLDNKKGFIEEELNLRSNLTFAEPMKSGNSYIMHVNIIDKNSDAYYNVKKDFSIIENPMLNTKTDGLTYEILYLFSQTRNISIIDNKISPNESVYILLEGLEGYKVDADGKVDLEASISLTEANGRVINQNDNLFEKPVSARDLKDQLYASISLTEGEVKNPVTCVFKIKDKNSGHTFETSLDLIVE